MYQLKSTILLLLLCFFNGLYAQVIEGELKKWHKISILFEGPETSEQAKENPFFNYRLNVTFRHTESEKEFVVPGYFAADGDAGNTGAISGKIWKVHFSPDRIGEWTYQVDFKKGK